MSSDEAAGELKPKAYPLGAHGATNKEHHVSARRRVGEAAGSPLRIISNQERSWESVSAASWQDGQNDCPARPQQPDPADDSNRSSNEAAGELQPEAYPQGYVEDCDEPRTKLGACFSRLLRRRPCWRK
jgi:hypothetical protein